MTLNKNTLLYRIRFLRPGRLAFARTVHNSKTFFLSFCYWLCSISLHTQSTATERMSAGAFLTVLISRRFEATGSVKLAENAKKKSSVPVCVCFVHGWKMNNNFFIWLPWKEKKKGDGKEDFPRHRNAREENPFLPFPLESDWAIRWKNNNGTSAECIFQSLMLSLNIIYGRIFFSREFSSSSLLSPLDGWLHRSFMK